MSITPDTSASTQYGMFAAQAQKAYQDALTNIQNQRADLLKSAGLEGVYGQDGTLQSTKVQSDAPYGGYQQLMQGLGSAGEQIDAQQAALGFGGGLAQQMHDQAQQQYSGQYNDWSQGVLGGIANLGQQQLQAGQDYNDALYQQQLATGYDPTKADFSGLADQYGPYGGNQQDPGNYGKNNNINPSGTRAGGGRQYTGRGRLGFGQGYGGHPPARRRRRR